MKVSNITAFPFLFLGGHPSVDWVNTLIVDKGAPVDLVGSFAEAARWLKEAHLIGTRTMTTLCEKWEGTKEGDRAMALAKQWRTQFKEGLQEIETIGKCPPRLLKIMNDRLRSFPISRTIQVVQKSGILDKKSEIHVQKAEEVVSILVESAADFLLSANLRLIRKCANPACVLHFYDQSKSHARRWCSMTLCGNRTKVAAHYKRSRPEAG